VAAVVYRRRQHVINLFIWPARGERDRSETSSASQGYNTIAWTRGEMNYTAVSDLNMKELGELTRAYWGAILPNKP
jgi:anti-sigma factor RsiW